jgi:hypothetical protein
MTSETSIQEKVRLFKRSGQVHIHWYRATYPDVEASGLHPAEHYARYGEAMGRQPGKGFDPAYYRHRYPEAAEPGESPLLHYIQHGQDRGYSPRPLEEERAEERRFHDTRTKLLSLGFTDAPLADLARLAEESDFPRIRARAARELAMWALRENSVAEAPRALERVAQARRFAPDLAFRRTLVTIEMMCHLLLGQGEEARQALERAALAGEVAPDAYLAQANFETRPEERCFWINQALRAYGIAPISLRPRSQDGEADYDRLTVAEDLPPVIAGPKVTVLLAAYDAAAILPTALRALQAQTWKNLEILVIDDCSPDDGATAAVAERFSAEDPRFRLIRMEQNGGAYVARNRGLDAATGEFVTIHDADDWSHPQKIEVQARHLMAHPEVMGCTSDQARMLEDLSFTKLRGNGQFIVFNTSSFMYRRVPVRRALGYWDTVRFGADNEFIRRMQAAFGRRSYEKVNTGPLSFQRDSESSVTADPVMGLGGAYYGVRKDYYDAQMYHQASGRPLKYDGIPDRRPFAVAPMMRPDRKQRLEGPRHFDLVIFGDFREYGPELAEWLAEIGRRRAQRQKVGLVEVADYRVQTPDNGMCLEFRRLVDGELVEILVYGDEVTAESIAYLNSCNIPDLRYIAKVRQAEPAA